MKDCQERQPEHAHLCTKGSSCVSVAKFGLGSWSLALTYRFTGPGPVVYIEKVNLPNFKILFHADV